MNRKYIATLALAAFLILAIGVFVRNRLLRAEPSTPAPPSEASTLQQFSQELQLRRMSRFLSDRVAAVAPAVEYVPEVGAAGVRWGDGDSVVTTLTDRPVALIHIPSNDSTRLPLVYERGVAGADTVTRDLALVVGRGADGMVLSSTGVLGGRAIVHCAGREISEFVFGAALGDAFAGAGLFTVDGRALGLVVRCGERNAAIPMSEVERLLAEGSSVAERVWNVFGFAVTSLDDATRSRFGGDSGVLVTELLRGGRADDAGLRTGDLILSVDGNPVATPDELGALAVAVADSHYVARRRGRVVDTVRFRIAGAAPGSDDDDATGIELSSGGPAGVEIGAVRGGSLAHEAGLRPGDRLLRVNDATVTSLASARRLLRAARGAPAFITFVRDSVERGVFLEARAR